jgi:hypothetical protein
MLIMPDTGLPWALPYPLLSDEADAPKYIQQLAEAVDLGLDSGGVAAFAKASAAQAIPNGVTTPLTVALDTGFTSPGFTLVNNAIVLPYNGLYMFLGVFSFTHNASGGRSGFIRKNAVVHMRFVAAVGTGSTSSIVGQYLFRGLAGDAIDWCGYQSSGAGLNTDSNSNGCSFQVQLMARS